MKKNVTIILVLLVLGGIVFSLFFLKPKPAVQKPTAPSGSDSSPVVSPSSYEEDVISSLDPKDKEENAGVVKEIFKVKEMTDKKELEKARERFLKLTQDKPNLVWGFVGLSLTDCRLENFDEAEKSAKKAVEMAPDLWLTWYCLNEIYTDSRVCRYKDAVETSKKWVETSPKSFDANFSLAEAYEHLGQKEKFIGQIKKAAFQCDLKEVDMYSLNQLVYYMLENDEDKLAHELLQKIEKEKPNSPEIYSAYGAYYEKMKKTAEAEKAYKKAIQLRPDYQNYYMKLASFYYKQGEYEKALEYVDKARKIPPNPDLRLEMEIYGLQNRIYIIQGENEKADKSLEEMLKNSIGVYGIEPDAVYQEYVVLQMELGNEEKAKSFLVKVLEKSPNNAKLLLEMAKVTFKEGNQKEAEEYLEKAIEHDTKMDQDFEGNIEEMKMEIRGEKGGVPED